MNTLNFNRFFQSSSRILTCGKVFSILFAAAALLTSVFTSSALAQTDLNGENKEITAAGPWNVSYTNSNTEKTSTITIGSLNNGTRYDYSGAITGNIALDVTHHSNVSNDNRFTLSNTGNSFTGGLTMHNGILFVTGANQIPSASNLTLDKTVLMNSAASLTFNNNLTIPSGSFAAFRPSASFTYSGVISGSGDLLITTENGNGVTLSGANTYTGVTSIGTHQGGTTSSGNNKAYLTLGANNTLPSTTVVEIARSQNSTYNYINAAEANLNLNGTTQTIAGLYGGGVASITNDKDAAANLTINVADDANLEYSGTIAGYSADKPTNLTINGAGNQTLAGVISNASITKEGTGTLTLSADNTYTGGTTISGGTLKLTDNGTMGTGEFINNATLEFAISSEKTFEKVISGTGALTKSETGTLILSDANTYTGGTTISGGTLKLTDSGTLGTGEVTNNATLEFANSSEKTFTNVISGTGALTKSGTGTLTLSADSISFSNLTVNGGNLDFTPNVKLNASGRITLSDSSNTLDLNGADLKYTSNAAGNFNNVNITNTNTDKQSVLTIAPTDDVSQPTYNKTISGNTRLVVKLKSNQNNNSRFILSGTNDHTGGLYIEQGTVKVDSYSALGSNKVIDMKHSSLMTNKSFDDYTINLVGDASKGERGAIRLSGASNFRAKITGVGSLEIVYDNAVTLTNTENDYQGKTYIGNFQWRSTNVSDPATLNLGASGVLPDTTDVVFGKNAEGAGTSGAITLNLQGCDETVSYISGQSTNASITSSIPATLTLIGNNDYTFVGKVTGSAALEKKGTGTLTMTGANTGSLAVSEGTLILSGNNSGAQSIVVGENGTLIPFGTKSAGSEVTMKGGTMIVALPSLTNNASINATEGDSSILLGLPSGTYARQLFTGTAKDMSNFTKPEFISNMDKIANTAYVPGSTDYFTADIWGSTTGDQNNTNLLQTSVVNTTDSPITLDFAYQFHNSAYLAITDSEGNKTVVMDWTNTANHTIGGKIYSYANNTGSFTFKPGETYTIEARLFRYNRTIGANGGGLNGFGGTLVGLGAKVSGTDGDYLPLNFDGDNWTFSDGSFTFRNQKMSFTSPVSISEGASITFDSPAGDIDVSSTISGEGTLIVNPEEGFTHTYSGSIADTISIAKSGEGTMAITGNCNSVGSVSVEAGTLEIAFDDPTTTLNIASIAMSEGTNINVASGAVTFDQENVTLNNLSGGSLKDDGTIDVASNVTVTNALTLNNIDTTKFIGSISANNIKKTGDGTLQLYSEASLGGIQAESFVVSSGRLDMKEYFKGSTEIESGATLSPGNSIGKLTIDGTVLDSEVDALILHTGSTLLMEVGGETPEENDMLIVLGDFTLEDGAVVQLVLTEDNTLGTNGNFAVQITADGIDLDTIENALSYYQFSGVTVTQNGSTFTITGAVDPNAVPEPSTWALLLLGVAGLIYWRKKNS